MADYVGFSGKDEYVRFMRMFGPDDWLPADMPASLQSATKVNSNVSKYEIQTYEDSPKRNNARPSLKVKSKAPSQPSEEVVNNKRLESEESLDIDVREMNKMEKQLSHNGATVLPSTSSEQASKSSGQLQKGCQTSVKDQMATTNATRPKPSKPPSTSRPRHGVTQRDDCQVSPVAVSPLVDHPGVQSLVWAHVKDEKLFSSGEPSLYINENDIVKATTVLAEKIHTAATGPQLDQQTSSVAEELRAGSGSSPNQSKTTTTGSGFMEHHKKTTTPGLVAGHKADATGIAPSTPKTCLLKIYNSGYIGTIQARDSIEISLVNNENGTIKLLDLSHQAQVDLQNAGHIDEVQLW